MKKIFLLSIIIVVIVAVSALSFMGCQGQTSLTQIFSESNIWNEATFPEVFTYNMYKADSNEVIGTLTMQVEKLNTKSSYYLSKDGIGSESDYIYSYTTASANATYITTTTLTLLDDSYTSTSIAIFANNFKILGSYNKVVSSSNEKITVSNNVDNKRYYYKTNADNFARENAIKNGKYITSPYFDNSMVYYVARSMPIDSSYTTFSFNIFDLDNNSKEKVTLAQKLETSDVVTIGETSFNTRKITMTTSDTLLGLTNNIACYINTSKYNNALNSIVAIQEGEYMYKLAI